MSILTRIKTNQITDQTVTGPKIVPKTLTGGLFASDLSMASNVTINGNLIVEGITTYSNIASVNTQINDPLIVFNNGYLGAPYADMGLILNRGLAPTSVAFIWNETDSRFETIYTTEDGGTYGSINNSGYANLRVYDFTSNSITTNQANFSTIAATGLIIGKDLWLEGNLTANGNTQSTSTNTGAIITAGGLGVEKNAYIGGDLNVAGNMLVSGNVTYIDVSQLNVEDPLLTLHTFANASPLTIDDGKDIGIMGRFYKYTDSHTFFGWSNDNQFFEYYTVAYESPSGVISGTLGTGRFGQLITTNSASSTSTTSGSMVIAGGAGIDGNINAGGGATFNQNQTPYDFLVSGETESTLLWVGGSAGQLVIGGNATSFIDGSKLTINANSSIIVPIGTTANRPSTPIAGMLRYNSSLNILEFYNGVRWKGTVPEFTVIVDQQFTANGNVSVFTLNQSGTQSSVIVSINGILQFPGLSYTVSDTTLTFSENPRNGDIIDVRNLITTTQVTELSSLEGYNKVILDTLGIHFYTGTISTDEKWLFDVGGNLVPKTTAVQTLGNANITVKTIYADSIVANSIASSNFVGISVPNSATPIDTFSMSEFQTAKYIISVKNGSNYSAREALLIHNGVNAFISESNLIDNGGGNLITLTASTFAGEALLIATGAISGNIVKLHKTYIPV